MIHYLKVSLASEFNSYKYLETLPPGKIELSLPTLPNAMGGVHGVPIIFLQILEMLNGIEINKGASWSIQNTKLFK